MPRPGGLGSAAPAPPCSVWASSVFGAVANSRSMSPVSVVARNEPDTETGSRVWTSPCSLVMSMLRAEPLNTTPPSRVRATSASMSACRNTTPVCCCVVTVVRRARSGGRTSVICEARPQSRIGDCSASIVTRAETPSSVTDSGSEPARAEFTIFMSTRGSGASRSVVMRTATGTEPVSTATVRSDVGSATVSATTRKVLPPRRVFPATPRLPRSVSRRRRSAPHGSRCARRESPVAEATAVPAEGRRRGSPR